MFMTKLCLISSNNNALTSYLCDEFTRDAKKLGNKMKEEWEDSTEECDNLFSLSIDARAI